MRSLILIASLIAMPIATSLAQGGGKTLASTLEIFVFPGDGQAADQQSKDEAECYSWAVGNTGSDPFELQKQAAQQQQQTDQQLQQAQSATQGAGVKGAIGGAAAGALIGEIADDDWETGAKYGAAAGAISARRRSRAASQRAQQQAKQQGAAQQQQIQQQADNFKKAFSVCLEAKNYLVK